MLLLLLQKIVTVLIFFGLGGNQGDEVKVGTYSVYPIEYTILERDYELPIYYTKNEKLSY